MQKVQKTYTAEFKREAVRLAQSSGKPITHIARETFASLTRRSINGERNWQSTAPKRFQAAGIRQLWRRKTAASNESWSEPDRNVTF
jgi:transposase-like protein